MNHAQHQSLGDKHPQAKFEHNADVVMANHNIHVIGDVFKALSRDSRAQGSDPLFLNGLERSRLYRPNSRDTAGSKWRRSTTGRQNLPAVFCSKSRI
jgi:hypothetical protein